MGFGYQQENKNFLIVAAVRRTKNDIVENLTMRLGYWTFRLQLSKEDKRFYGNRHEAARHIT